VTLRDCCEIVRGDAVNRSPIGPAVYSAGSEEGVVQFMTPQSCVRCRATGIRYVGMLRSGIAQHKSQSQAQGGRLARDIGTGDTPDGL
jgi:hypothetical protein